MHVLLLLLLAAMASNVAEVVRLQKYGRVLRPLTEVSRLRLRGGPDAKATPRYTLVIEPGQRIACTYTIRIEAGKMRATEWVLFAALPPVLPGQTDITAGLSPQGKPVRDLSPLKRGVLCARIPVTSSENVTKLDAKWTVQARLHARHLVEVANGAPVKLAPPLNDDARRLALGSNTLVDHDSPAFRQWLKEQDLLRQTEESDLDFARRTFLKLREQCSYEYTKEVKRQASVVCKSGKSDCGGHSALFVAVLRANKVPARVLIGRWATSSTPGDKLEGLDYYQFHVKAEFHAAGIGWVPIDLSAAVTDKNRDRPLRFFGHDAGDFLVCHVDHDLKIDSLVFGPKTIDGLQGVQYYVAGTGDFDSHKTTQRWDVKRLAK